MQNGVWWRFASFFFKFKTLVFFFFFLRRQKSFFKCVTTDQQVTYFSVGENFCLQSFEIAQSPVKNEKFKIVATGGGGGREARSVKNALNTKTGIFFFLQKAFWWIDRRLNNTQTYIYAYIMVTVIYYKDLKLRKGKLDCLNNISIFTTKNCKNCLSCYIKPFYLGLKGQKKKN